MLLVVELSVSCTDCKLSGVPVSGCSWVYRLSVVGCRLSDVFAVGCLCRLSLPFSTVSAQLCRHVNTKHIPNICNNFAVGEEESNDETIGRLHPVSAHHKTEGEF